MLMKVESETIDWEKILLPAGLSKGALPTIPIER